MRITVEEIENFRTVLAMKTIMGYAPARKAAIEQRLEKLIMGQQIESAVQREVKKQLKDLNSISNKIKTRVRREGFWVSSFLLAESFAYLSRHPEESLHFCTGVKLNRMLTVDTMIPVGLKSATVISAEADNPEVFRVLSALDRTGHPLTGVMHIHPGSGARAIYPPGVDQAYMQRLSGRRLVFGIWARDGLLRLITLPPGQRIQIFGEGIRELETDGDDKLYELSAPGRSVLGFGAGTASPVVGGRKLV